MPLSYQEKKQAAAATKAKAAKYASETAPVLDANVYLSKPVTNKKKTGQASFLQLASYLFLDMDGYTADIDSLVVMIANVMNFAMHNSTHSPAVGYGKAQKDETASPQQYYRSQQDHPHRMFFDHVTRDQARKVSVLPRNEAFVRIVEKSKIGKSLHDGLKKYDSRGFVKENESVPAYFSLFLAYSGARANNHSVYQAGLTHPILKFKTGHEQLKCLDDKLRDWLPKRLPKEIQRLSLATVSARIKAFKAAFKKLKARAIPSPSNQLLTAIHETRTRRIKTIQTRAAQLNLTQLSLKPMNGTSCLYVNLYPHFKDKIRDSANYAEGVTNVIIGFFGGLLNHHAKRRKLYIHTNRRQSFGFMRPTLADLGTLSIRLSLGVEPEIYNEVVLDALKDLDAILQTFDFTNPKCPKIASGFVTVENPKGAKATERTGNRMLSAMRSDGNKCQAAKEALHYLQQTGTTVTHAFQQYFDTFIVNQTAVVTSDDIYQINGAVIEGKHTSNSNEVIFKLLTNLLSYAREFATTLPDVESSMLTLNSMHVYCHCLSKLYRNCDKAAALLDKLQEYEPSHLYAKANLLIENILEYLIILEDLKRLSTPTTANNAASSLIATEKSYYENAFACGQENAPEVFFTDSGQQALTASILAMEMQHMAGKQTAVTDATVYLQSSVYYELGLFMDKLGELRTHNVAGAKTILTDISSIDTNEIDQAVNLKSLIIDVTNSPTLDKTLIDLVAKYRKRGIYVVLASSLLKQEELGLDKYQAGKIVVLPPTGKTLAPNVLDELQLISQTALNPTLATFFQMINNITREKTPPCTASTSTQAGLFAQPHPTTPPDNQAVKTPTLQ